VGGSTGLLQFWGSLQENGGKREILGPLGNPVKRWVGGKGKMFNAGGHCGDGRAAGEQGHQSRIHGRKNPADSFASLESININSPCPF